MRTLFFALALSVLAVPVTAAPLTEQELTQAITGNTYEIRRMGMKLAMTIASDGTINSQTPMGEMSGTWRIEVSDLCMDLPRMGARCRGVEDLGNGRLQLESGQELRRQ